MMDTVGTASVDGASTGAPKARIFISYSRKDIAFADRLDAALRERGIEALIDRTEIYAFEDWWKRIQALIAQADTVIFVLSRQSAASEICAKEVAYAQSLNKRFAPVVIEPVDDRLVPDALARLNFIFFDDASKFDASFERLAQALTTDIGWIRRHTEFGQTARQWSAAGQSNGLLLRSPLLEEAELWIASRPTNAPAPTEETRAFIAASRSGATRRRNVLTGSLAAGLILALVLAGLAYWQRGIAIENEARAVANDKAANSQRIENLKSGSRLVAVATHQLVDENRPDLAQAIALEGLPEPATDRPLVDEAYKALTRAVRADRSLAVLTLGREQFESAVFSRDGKTLVTGTSSGKLVVWDVEAYQPRLRIEAGDTGLFKISLSPDGRSILDGDDKHPSVWDLASGKLVLRLPAPEKGYAGSSRFSPDGKTIAIGYSANYAEIRDAATGALRYRLDGPADFDTAYAQRAPSDLDRKDPIAIGLAQSQWRSNGSTSEVLFSPNGKLLAVAGIADPGGAARVYDVATGKLVAMLAGENLVMSLAQQRMAFSPDSGTLALAGTDNVVRLWNATEGKLLFALPHTAESHALTFDPTGAFLLVGYADGSVRVWSVQDGRIVATFAGHVGTVTSIAFSPDGTTFATASNDRDVRVWWNTLDQENCGSSSRAIFCDARLHVAAVLRGHTDKVTQVVASPQAGVIASIAGDAAVRIWRTTGLAGEVALHLPGQERYVEKSCEPPKPKPQPVRQGPPRKPTDEEVRQKAIELFGQDAANEDIEVLRTRVRERREAVIRQMAVKYGFPEDEAATEDIETLLPKLQERVQALLEGQEQAEYEACKFANLMAQLEKGHRKSSVVFQRSSEQMGRRPDLPKGSDDAYRIAFDDKAHLLAPNENGRGFALLDLATGKALCQLPGDRLTSQSGVLMLQEGPFVAKPVQCQPEEKEALPASTPSDHDWVMSPNGARAVGSNEWLLPAYTSDDTKPDENKPLDERKMLLDTAGKRAIAALQADGRNAHSALFSADGRIVIGALAGDNARSIWDDSQYALWSADTGQLLGITAPGKAELHNLSIAADGRRFVLAGDGRSAITLYFLDADGALKSRVMADQTRDLSAIAITPDGATVAAAYVDGSIAFFSADDGKLTATLPVGLYPVIRLTFAPGGQVLAGADTNRTVWLWDVPSKAPLFVTSVRGEPTALTFSPAGDRLAVRTDKGEVRVLAIGLDYLKLKEPQDIVDWARASLSASLSEADRQRFLLARTGARGKDAGGNLLFNLGSISNTAASATAAPADKAALRQQAAQTAMSGGLPGVGDALGLALRAAGGNAADAAFQIGLDIDRAAPTEEARALAYFYLQLGQRFTEASPASAANTELHDAAVARLRVLPRQIAPATLISTFRSARRWPSR